MTPKQLRAALKKLGFNPVEVARSLMDRGIKGKIHDSAHCPVSIYLQLAGAPPISIGRHCIDCKGFKIRIPGFIARFIQQFNAGHWPELIEPCSTFPGHPWKMEDSGIDDLLHLQVCAY